MNMSKDMGKLASLNFQRTIMWGHTFEFSPSIINQYWNCPDVPNNEVEAPGTDPMVFVITGGKVRTWPYKYNLCSSYLASSTLSCIRLLCAIDFLSPIV